ncbi:DUF1275 family protein [Nonomuraea sp. NPDC050691]|uniref:DUF1275 family protein n=1 Tax=Nonomuraea sp. NPDC050691 TaxID=3155661 RepID=UPI0033D70AEE
MPFATGSRPERLTVILVLLTGVTGVVEAVSFLGLGRVFTAVMTGNVLFAGFGLFNDEFRPAGPVVSLAAFAAGAIAGHWANGVLVRRRGPRWLTFAIAGEGVLILVAALRALLLGVHPALPLLVAAAIEVVAGVICPPPKV